MTAAVALPAGVLDAPARLLFLSQDPAGIAAQLDGAASGSPSAAPLRDDISTDEITPVPILTHFDEKLGRYPYTGLAAGTARPIGIDAIKRAGVNVVPHGRKVGRRALGHRREL
ncbi:hypothetical protein G6F23_012556 [Rhizopus arrhizus]|nr:hypothetical protein G6F23_012556 [Rhizopus arrhizus]